MPEGQRGYCAAARLISQEIYRKEHSRGVPAVFDVIFLLLSVNFLRNYAPPLPFGHLPQGGDRKAIVPVIIIVVNLIAKFTAIAAQ